MTTLQRLQSILQGDFDVKPDALHATARLADLGIDSLTMVEILFRVEDEFKITVPSGTTESKATLETVGDLVAYIDALADEQQHASPARKVAS